jgi:hypothetical protein
MRYFVLGLLLLLVAAQAADRDLVGRYAGDWKSNGNDSGGAFRMSLETAGDGAWKCAMTFTVSGDDVVTTARQCKVENSKLEASYDFNLQGAALRSQITGAWNGQKFTGQYQTTVVEGGAPVDDGTWSAARAAN